jgi:aldehyde:ferredoxin oxidoreductase
MRSRHPRRTQIPTARVAAIGKAGENLVRFATISNEGRHAGAAALAR